MNNIPEFEQFKRLFYRLEPENLYCDGECSESEARQRERQIMREWKALEKQTRTRVQYDDVERAIWAEIQAQQL